MNNRECLILCNFSDKERKLIKSYALMMGIRDLINVTFKESNNTIENILNNKYDQDIKDDGVKDRVVIFNNIEPKKVSIFIDNMRKMRIGPSMKAVVTETSINWTLDKLLKNLVEERKYEKTGKTVKHID